MSATLAQALAEWPARALAGAETWRRLSGDADPFACTCPPEMLPRVHAALDALVSRADEAPEAWAERLAEAAFPPLTYLWLTEPACEPVPLATWDGTTLVWAGGEQPDTGSSFLDEVLSSLEWMLRDGARFDQEGMGRGNIHEGPAFAASERL